MNEELIQENTVDQSPEEIAQQGQEIGVQGGLTPDEAAASLSLATKLSEDLMGQNAPMENVSQETEPTEELELEEAPEEEEKGSEDISKKVSESVKKELQPIISLLKEMLNDEDEEE